jgi:hypothetical protein
MQLSKNFALNEMLFSRTAAMYGIKNLPNEQQIEALRQLCVRVLQPLRDHLKVPVVVTSGFRSPAVNKRIKGSPTSQHMKGEAADIYVPGMPTDVLMDKIRSLHLPFDQLIDEFDSWVHVSHAMGGQQRKMVMQAYRESGKILYRGIV